MLTAAHAVLPVTFSMHALELLIEGVYTLGYYNTQFSIEDTNEMYEQLSIMTELFQSCS